MKVLKKCDFNGVIGGASHVGPHLDHSHIDPQVGIASDVGWVVVSSVVQWVVLRALDIFFNQNKNKNKKDDEKDARYRNSFSGSQF